MTPETLTPTVTTDPAVGKGVLLFDGDCPFCRHSVAILKRLDWLGKLHLQSVRDRAHWPPSAVPLDEAKVIEEMHVVTPDRREAYAGFAAFRWVAARLPLTVPLVPLLYVPGALWLGNRVYRWVARNRFNLVPCAANACAVPLGKLKRDS